MVIFIRRVRENPGGKDSLANFWDAEEDPAEFKPTRRCVLVSIFRTHIMIDLVITLRVREGPGGQDNINNVSPVCLSAQSRV